MIPVPLELLAALAPGLVPVPPAPLAPRQDEPEVAVAPSLDVLSNSALHDSLAALARSPRVELTSVATSRGGRAIHAVKVSGSGDASRPAILVVAGLDGPRSYTSSIAVDHVRRLVDGYASDEGVQQFLDSTTVYCIPRVDVDAAAARFASPLAEVHGTGHGVDNDRDGRQGEDPPADVNGDGFITMMRVATPEGGWVVDPTDPRAMKEADRKAGERGVYELHTEGYDSDGDERVAEDPLLDAAVNRNFGRNWGEHADDAGRYPTDEPGVLGVVEYVLERSDIALVVTYGDEANLGEKPKTQADGGPSKRGAIQVGIYEADAAVHGELGERYRELTGSAPENLEEQPGSFQGWAYHHRGRLCLNIDPWSVPLDAKAEESEEVQDESVEDEAEQESSKAEDAPKPSDDAKRLLWLDQNGVDAFVPWTPYDHPQLGEVEIGGFKPYALVEPRPQELGDIAARHFEHLVSLGELLPRPTLEVLTSRDLGAGLIEVEAALTNEALLPLQSRAAARARSVPPVQVHLDLPDGASLVAGERRTLVSSLDGVGGRREFRWLFTLPADGAGAELRLESKNAGQARTALEVK